MEFPFGYYANGGFGGDSMMPGQLVKAVSIALDVPEETVVQHDRNLVMAGLRTKGGRGRSAPEVTTLDAARLFIAILGSIRTKDSVDTVKQFERAIFQGKYVRLGGAEMRTGEGLRAQEFDNAIVRLPLTHNLIEALAALIDDASKPIENLQSFLERFAQLNLSCSSPSGHAKIGEDLFFVKYSSDEASPNRTREEPGLRQILLAPKAPDERRYFASGVQQERSAYGAAIMLLGAAFRENGPRFANAREAFLAGYGTHDQGRKTRAEAIPRSK
jgi:hypothetical protein